MKGQLLEGYLSEITLQVAEAAVTYFFLECLRVFSVSTLGCYSHFGVRTKILLSVKKSQCNVCQLGWNQQKTSTALYCHGDVCGHLSWLWWVSKKHYFSPLSVLYLYTFMVIIVDIYHVLREKWSLRPSSNGECSRLTAFCILPQCESTKLVS